MDAPLGEKAIIRNYGEWEMFKKIDKTSIA
jgi:hypothetical protein